MCFELSLSLSIDASSVKRNYTWCAGWRVYMYTLLKILSLGIPDARASADADAPCRKNALISGVRAHELIKLRSQCFIFNSIPGAKAANSRALGMKLDLCAKGISRNHRASTVLFLVINPTLDNRQASRAHRIVIISPLN